MPSIEKMPSHLVAELYTTNVFKFLLSTDHESINKLDHFHAKSVFLSLENCSSKPVSRATQGIPNS